MAVELNHTIVPSHDKVGSSQFLAEILGIDPPESVMRFMQVRLSNGVAVGLRRYRGVPFRALRVPVSDDEFDGISTE